MTEKTYPVIEIANPAINELRRLGITPETIREIYEKYASQVAEWIGKPGEQLPVNHIEIHVRRIVQSRWWSGEYWPKTGNMRVIVEERGNGILGSGATEIRKALRRIISHETVHAGVFSTYDRQDIDTMLRLYQESVGMFLLHELPALALESRDDKGQKKSNHPELEIGELFLRLNHDRSIDDIATREKLKDSIFSNFVCNFALWLADKYGMNKIIQLPMEISPGTTTNRVLEKVLGVNLEELQRQYLQDITKRRGYQISVIDGLRRRLGTKLGNTEERKNS